MPECYSKFSKYEQSCSYTVYTCTFIFRIYATFTRVSQSGKLFLKMGKEWTVDGKIFFSDDSFMKLAGLRAYAQVSQRFVPNLITFAILIIIK